MFHLQKLDFWASLVHPPHVGRILHRLRTRRRERELAQQLERRFRERLDASATAAARLVDDLRR
jgi:hypothetical protein